MIASLPMYDWPHRQAGNDALWAHLGSKLRAAGFAAPARLSRPKDVMAHWRRPTLLLSQTCAMPYRLGLWRWAEVLGTLDYGLSGCAPGQYCSVLIAHRDDTRTNLAEYAQARPAVNARHSQSGWAALCDAAGCAGINLGRPVITGAHAASVRAVAQARAAIAAIDAVSWQLASEALAEAREVRVIGFTRPSPALPFICARGQDVEGLQNVLAEAFATLSEIGAPAARFLPRNSAQYREESWG